MNAKGLVFLFTAMMIGCVSDANPDEGDLLLIAHRGVVNEHLSENSLASLEETISRGYTHIEVDLRVTKDGHAVCLHDRNLMRTTGQDRNIDEVTLEELYTLVSPRVVPTFEVFAALSAGRIKLMPDLKGAPEDLVPAFTASLERTLGRYGLMEGALFIGKPEIARSFLGKGGKLSYREPLSKAKDELGNMRNAQDNYFVFNHAADFNKEEVEGFQELGMQVIVSINTFHYEDVGEDPIAGGNADVARMIELGVDGLQIDSVYDGEIFGKHLAGKHQDK